MHSPLAQWDCRKWIKYNVVNPENLAVILRADDLRKER
jgi:hypothetical protein